MRWIGLTGSIATGKSTVARLFEGRGIPVLDADLISAELVGIGSPGLEKIVLAFGPNVLKDDGALDRSALGSLVFKNKSALETLESIVHPLVQQEVALRRAALIVKSVGFAIYDVPLLFEKKMEKQFAGVVVVGCDPELQIERLMRRNNFDRPTAQQRINAQISILEKRKWATWYIDNSGTLDDLQIQFDLVFKQISQSAKA